LLALAVQLNPATGSIGTYILSDILGYVRLVILSQDFQVALMFASISTTQRAVREINNLNAQVFKV
jgi:hypothetical protein